MMPHQKLVLTAVVMLTCTSVVIGYPHGLDTSIQFCGSNLADVLELACQSRGGLHGPGALPTGNVGPRKGAGGVTRECCDQPCSWRTVLSYCVNSTIDETQENLLPPPPPVKPDEDNIFSSNVYNLIFEPNPVPKRRSRKSECPIKCNCVKRTRKNQPDRNRLSNNLNVGTVPPALARHPVIVRNL
ncbi:uncharacterized protein LOC132201112 isoform X2 [Neocloeon triangulifer]|nr:uncharacterized protein LOC132201112 isoform X2 [Neocloeon triangulifer]